MSNRPVSLAALKSFHMFQNLSDERLEPISRCAILRNVGRGAIVLHAGDRTDYIYFVLSGNLKVLVSDEDGREVILTMIGPGEVFGEMGVLDEDVRSATVLAVSSANLVVMSKGDFKRVMLDNAEVALQITRNLVQRLRQADRQIESLALLDVYGRVARLLLDMAEDVGGQKVVTRKISKQDIAKMIGASREMVSRVMKDLNVHGLIEETDGKVILHEHAETI
jgi:CRP/FNR family cyclic AMP-dependent transcriptional regulator